ncbi:MAG: DUF1553 domain-containing protein [Planctomycetales bacterium]|nr:DUF1553 domain-containing protein [Planctomycetales bacterium]
MSPPPFILASLRRSILPGLLASLCLLSPAAEAVDFAKQIVPLLQRHCIRCHTGENPEGDLSLATPAGLREGGWVVPGDPKASRFLELVTGEPGNAPRMPQEGKPLSADEVETLRQWIASGAQWPAGLIIKAQSAGDRSWWSFQPLQANATAGPAAIDRFLREKLSEQGLRLSPQAERRILIRRLTFDLHGLPPTPEAVAAFEADSRPDAYERLVDELLESPRYGERYAQHWLDLAHYADTHGFERDRRRDHAWRYRDYVIRALNADKPYYRFLQEQIAGDVLWPDDDQSVIATGFLAAGPWDYVGQVETKSPELRRSARSLDLDDMATQVMTACVAMTVHCARCHDHKLDPISQREYYELRAVFAGVRREERVVSEAAEKRHQRQLAELQRERDALDFEIGRLEGSGLSLADVVGGGNGWGTGKHRQGIDVRNAKVQTRDFGKLGNVVVNRFTPSPFPFVDGVFVPDGKQGEAEIVVSSTGTTIRGLPTTGGDAWDMIRNGPVASQHSTELDGVDFGRDRGRLLGLHANAGITFDLAAIRQAAQLGELRLVGRVGYFGAKGDFRADARVYVDGRLAAEFVGLKRESGLRSIELALPQAARFLTLVSTDGGNGFSHDQICFANPRLIATERREVGEVDRQRLTDLREQQADVRRRIESLGPAPRFFGVAALSSPEPVQVLTRGNPETPVGDTLAPAALTAPSLAPRELGDADSAEGQRRAALAKWLTHPDNPLTPRVIVNRLWQWHFGRGLVETPSDFGAGGARPSHPELLDWLAAELVRREGSLKAMHRLIVTSEAYRQRSQAGEGAATDAENRWLWRQNPRRIEAEAVRDAVLSVSGKLNTRQGGPGYEDFQYQDAYAPIYTYVTADEPALWRRSIYRYVVRTTPSRFLTTLDCPDPANLTSKRLTTTTPLQSLALFNNEFMLKQAGYFAARVRREAPTTTAQVRRAFELAFGRPPSPTEARLSEALVKRHGLFSLCRSLFNANEFVYVD